MEKGCYKYKVEPREVDFSLRASVVAMCDYILAAAGDDADRNHFGVRDLNCDGCSWVLLRMGMEIERRLGQDEEFTVRTWVNDVNRMMTTRNMVIRDARGEIVASAVTQWAIIDTEKRRAVDITSHADFRNAIINDPSPVAVPQKIAPVDAQHTETHRVVYSDIDFNRHVGSVKYIGWMIDMLPEEIIMYKDLTRLDVNFLHEARFGQVLEIGYSQDGSSRFEVRSGEGQPVCRSVMQWK